MTKRTNKFTRKGWAVVTFNGALWHENPHMTKGAPTAIYSKQKYGKQFLQKVAEKNGDPVGTTEGWSQVVKCTIMFETNKIYRKA